MNRVSWQYSRRAFAILIPKILHLFSLNDFIYISLLSQIAKEDVALKQLVFRDSIHLF